jgi:uncharacterized protein YaaW (UPF0174 family)
MSLSNIRAMREEVAHLKNEIVNAQTEMRELEMIAFRTMGYFARLSGNEDIDATLRKIQQAIMLMRLAQTTARMFMLASGPLGWAMFAVSAVGTAMATADFATSMNGYG